MDSIPAVVRMANDQYIKERLGREFIEQHAVFRGSVVVRRDQFKERQQVQPWIDKDLCNDRVDFAFQHYFIVQDSIHFYFTTVFDRNGQYASSHQIPDLPEGITEWIDICEARRIADLDAKYPGRTENISFEFHERGNRFVWRAQKPQSRKDRTVTTPFVLIDARTGIVVDHTIERGTIACQLGSW